MGLINFVACNVAICEDPEMKERIIELKSEQETRQDAARRKLPRTQSSNSRTQSIRRTSQRDKGLTSKRDAADEAQKLLLARASAALTQVSEFHIVESVSLKLS